MTGNDQTDVTDFLSGLLLGALIGAGAALLMAPRSGRATRRRIVRLAEDWGDSASEGLQKAAEDARRIAEDARRRIEDSSGKIAGAVEKSRRRLKV